MALFLNETHIAALSEAGQLRMEDCVDAVERVYREQGLGQMQLLPRHNFWLGASSVAERGHSLKVGAAALPGVGLMGVVGYSSGYVAGHLELWVQLFSADTGELLSVLRGRGISLWKTGASAAVAARHLAREDARIVGIIGTGLFARTQLTGLAAVRPIAEVRCFSRNANGRRAFAEWARMVLPDVTVRPVESAREATENVDILVTVTKSKIPVTDGTWISPGTHCNVVGAHYPNIREVDTIAVQKSRVIVDDVEQAWGEKGEIIIPLERGEITREHVIGDLGSVISSKIVGRSRESDITMFCSGGVTAEYIGACAMLYEKARAVGVGQRFG